MNDARPCALCPPFHRNAEQELMCGQVSLEKIAQDYGTPTFVYSAQAIEDAYQAFAAAAGPNVLICYALKANPNIAIVRLLGRLGAGFDIVSEGELRRVLAAGGDPARIVFSGVGKTVEELKTALGLGIKCINVESIAELERISEVASSMGLIAPVSLRVNPDIDAETHPYISTGLKDNKFGIAIEDAPAVYQHAASLPSLNVCGIDCHIGSQITSLGPFTEALDAVLRLADQLREMGLSIKHLDLGGGLGICYQDETPPSPELLLRTLLQRVSAWAKACGQDMPQVLFEFGRALVGNAGLLLSRVEVLKPGEHKNFAVIDAAMNDLMRPALYDAWHDVRTVSPVSSPAQTWDIVGPVCESGDWLAKSRHLSLAPGSLVAILSAGAYGMSMSSNYNSRPRAAELLIDAQHEVHLIRRRERFEDLIAAERIPPFLNP
jgi:diaminopimelate decarboxylase